MKRIFVFCIALILIFAAGALAEGTAEYRDALYAFRYPASWSCDTAPNGDIILGSPDGKSAVLTFAGINELLSFTGDARTDAPAIESYISTYGGKNLALTGEYTLTQSGGLRGFRAPGSWRATGQEAVMLLLTGDGLLVGFVLVGDGAIALEADFLASVELLGGTSAESAEGFLHWEGAAFSENHPEGALFALDYPAHYGALEQTTGVVFINPGDPNCIIMARGYTLDFDYSDAVAPGIAASALPKSTGVEPNAEMVKIGGKNAAVIRGAVSTGPMAFYVIGGGRTALALLFTGEEACDMAERVIASAVIK